MTNQEYSGTRDPNKATVGGAVFAFLGLFVFFSLLWLAGVVGRFIESAEVILWP